METEKQELKRSYRIRLVLQEMIPGTALVKKQPIDSVVIGDYNTIEEAEAAFGNIDSDIVNVCE